MRKTILFAFTAVALALTGATTANAGSNLPPKACKGDGKYHRTYSDLFKKHGLMAVCDAQYGATNIKAADGGTTGKPMGGPLKLGRCVVSLKGDVKKASAAGCRVGVKSAREEGEKLIIETTGGPVKY